MRQRACSVTLHLPRSTHNGRNHITTSAEIGADALDTLVNHALLSVMYDSENAKNGTRYRAAASLTYSAGEPLYQTLKEIAPDVSVSMDRAFKLGLQIARIVIAAPFADHRETIRALLERAIEQHRSGTAPTGSVRRSKIPSPHRYRFQWYLTICIVFIGCRSPLLAILINSRPMSLRLYSVRISSIPISWPL
jgi:hypothetical protein